MDPRNNPLKLIARPLVSIKRNPRLIAPLGMCLRIRGCGSRELKAAYESGVVAIRDDKALRDPGLWHLSPGEKDLFAA